MRNTAHQNSSIYWRRYLPLYALIAPTFILIITFYYYPALSGFIHSFTIWDPSKTLWAGLDNYREMLRDPNLLGSALNLVIVVVFNTLVTITMPLMAATLLFHLPHQRVQYFFRVIFVMPMIVPFVVIILFWRWFYSLQGGLNILLNATGLSILARNWLGDSATVLAAILFINFPWVSGLQLLIYLAGLQAIPQNVLDAAIVDGATGFRRFWHVELPAIAPQIKVLVLLTFVWWMRTFEAPLIMTDGGPGWSSMLPGLRMYHTIIRDFDLGYGAAIGMILFTLIFIGTLLQIRIRGAEHD
jgi:raffinose/stachyose/melibiose transport system permease protein